MERQGAPGDGHRRLGRSRRRHLHDAGADRVARTVEASADVLAAAPNVLILEHMDWWQPLFTEPLRLEEGCVVLSGKPGLGLDLERRALDRFIA